MCKQNSLNSKILTSYKVPSNIEFINELLKKEVANNKHKIIVCSSVKALELVKI